MKAMLFSSRRRFFVMLLISIGMLFLLLGGVSPPQASGAPALPDPASSVSTFPTQIEMEFVFTPPFESTQVYLVGQWNQTSGSNGSLPVQINVNEINQTFSIASLENLTSFLGNIGLFEYNMSLLRLEVFDPNGTGTISMVNPGTIDISPTDAWSYSPVGTETGTLYVGEYFMIQPGTSQIGLFGLPNNPFPPFPTITYHILIFHITVPNILAIPQWIGEIVVWAFNELVIIIAIGWEDVIEVPVKYIGDGITYIADLYEGIWTDVYNIVAPLPDGLGIFALPVASLVFGVLLFVTVASFALIGEAIVKLVTE